LSKKAEIVTEMPKKSRLSTSDRKIYQQYRSGNVHNASTTLVLYSGIKNSKRWILVFIAFCEDSLHLFKELNLRRSNIYVEIPKPSRVELKCSQNLRGFWYLNIDPTPRV
jgi:hypothetical protein